MDRFLVKKGSNEKKDPQKRPVGFIELPAPVVNYSLNATFIKAPRPSSTNDAKENTMSNPFAVNKRTLQQQLAPIPCAKEQKPMKRLLNSHFPVPEPQFKAPREMITFRHNVQVDETSSQEDSEELSEASDAEPEQCPDKKPRIPTVEEHATSITVDGSQVHRVKQAFIDSFLAPPDPTPDFIPENLAPEVRMKLTSANYTLCRSKRVMYQASHFISHAAEIDAMIYSRLHLSSLQFASSHQVASRVGVTSIVFDETGELVAVGGSNGCIRVYDFNEIIFRTTSMSAATSPHLRPVVSVMTGKDISSIVWVSDALLAVAHRYSSIVHIYDLEAYMSSPSPTPLTQISTPGNGNTALCYVPSKSILVMGSTMGILSGYFIGSAGASTRFSVKADSQTHEGSHTAIVSILQISDTPTLLAVAMYSGVVCVYNCDKMATQSFSRQMRPECVYRVSAPAGDIIGMVATPCNMEVALTTRLGYVHTMQLLNFAPEAITATYERVIHHSSGTVLVDDDEPPVMDEVTSVPQVTCSAVYMKSAKGKILLRTTPCLATQPDCVCVHQHDRYLTTITKPLFAPANGMTFTVPGYILNASPGCALVDVSCDLKDFLCSKLTTSAGCCVKNYRSHMVKLCVGSATSAGTLYLIEKIDSHSILFDAAYAGPSVCNGEPRVYLRTNITPVSGKDSDSSLRLTKIECKMRVTALSSHPSAPYAMLGMWDDSVRLMSC